MSAVRSYVAADFGVAGAFMMSMQMSERML
jgi:hypothetical protein